MQNHPTFAGWVYLSEKLDRLAARADCAPKIHLEHRTCIGVGRALDLAKHGVPGIVKQDIESSKNFSSPVKGSGDVSRTGDIQGEEKESRRRIQLGEMRKSSGFAEGRDSDVAFAEHDLSDGFSEP